MPAKLNKRKPQRVPVDSPFINSTGGGYTLQVVDLKTPSKEGLRGAGRSKTLSISGCSRRISSVSAVTPLRSLPEARTLARVCLARTRGKMVAPARETGASKVVLVACQEAQ
jgi:hypothetical protein